MLDDASRLIPASITITIGAEEVAMLISMAGPAHQSDPVWTETLQIRGSGGRTVDPDDPRFLSGSLFWCERAIEAMAVCQYERACGYNATMLWDVDADGTDLDRDVILSSRPFPQPARTSSAADEHHTDELATDMRPLYEVAADLAAVVADLPPCEYLQTYLMPLHNFAGCTGYYGGHSVGVLVAYLRDAIEHQPALPTDIAQSFQDELERHLQFSVRTLRDNEHGRAPRRAASVVRPVGGPPGPDGR
jgi:hypothetical protein